MDTVVETPTRSAPAEQTASSTDMKRPVKTFRQGSLSLSLWARTRTVGGNPKTFYSAALERSYQNKQGKTAYTKTFDADDLPLVAKLCTQAFAYVQEQQ